MNAIFLLIGLLVLSYLGSLLMTRRRRGGAGLPSGVEFAALGFILGPHVLGLVSARDSAAFEPVVQVAIGWLAFGIGMEFGYAEHRRVRVSNVALATVGALLTGGAIAAAAWMTTRLLRTGLSDRERILLAGGLGASCSETTRYAVRWIADRYRVQGPLADQLDEIAHTSSLVPLLAVAVLFALDPTDRVAVLVPLRDWPVLTVGLAGLLGAGAALLLRAEMPIEDTWGVLFGVSLLAIGIAARLALSTLAIGFFVGLTVSALSRHARELRDLVAPTERPVLLPALLLAGARIDFRVSPALPWLALAVIAARLAAKIWLGWLLAVGSKPARRAGPLVGLSLMSSGTLAMSIGLAFALRFPGPVGDTVLAVAAISAVMGELVGPGRLRRALAAAGEIEDSAARTPTAEKAIA